MKSILLPDDVYEQAAALAERDHVSVNRLVAALAISLSSVSVTGDALRLKVPRL